MGFPVTLSIGWRHVDGATQIAIDHRVEAAEHHRRTDRAKRGDEFSERRRSNDIDVRRPVPHRRAGLADDLAEWIDQPNQNTTDGILQLLSETDRDRLCTVLFEVEDVRRHADWLFSAPALPAFRNLLELLGEESETACWSVHLNDDVHSELHVRTRVAGATDILGPRGLAELLSTRMTDVPQRLLMFGGQTDEHDFHYVGLDFDILCGYLRGAGFTGMERVGEFGLFEDDSTIKFEGQPISLNVVAYK